MGLMNTDEFITKHLEVHGKEFTRRFKEREKENEDFEQDLHDIANEIELQMAWEKKS